MFTHNQPEADSHAQLVEVRPEELTQVEGGYARSTVGIDAINNAFLCYYTGSDVGFPHID